MNVPSPQEADQKLRSSQQNANVDELSTVERPRGSLLNVEVSSELSDDNTQSSGKKGARPAAAAPSKKKHWKKPSDMPKRPLSAYNIFFKRQREQMLGDEAKEYEIVDQSKRKHRKTHGKIGFAEMAKKIGQKWKTLDPSEKKEFEELASEQKAVYVEAMKAYKQKKKKEEETKMAAKKDEESSMQFPFAQEQGTGLTRAPPDILQRRSMPGIVQPAGFLGANLGLALGQRSALEEALDHSLRRDSLHVNSDLSNLALAQLQQQQQQQALEQALLGSGNLSYLAGYDGVDATRAALTAAFSEPSHQLAARLLDAQQLQQSQRLFSAAGTPFDRVQNVNVRALQQQQSQQTVNTEELLRLHLARQSLGLGGASSVASLGASGRAAPPSPSAEQRVLDYLLARQQLESPHQQSHSDPGKSRPYDPSKRGR